MTTIVLGCDINGKDSSYQNTVANVLRKGGYKVKTLAINPSDFANYGYTSKAKGKIGIYLMAASLVSVTDVMSSGWYYDKTFFGIRGDISKINSKKRFENTGIPKDHHGDCTNSYCDKWQGKTYPEINNIIASKNAKVVFASSPTDFANEILELLGGSSVGGGSSGGGSTGGGSSGGGS